MQLIKKIVLNQKKELEQKLEQRYVQRKISVKGAKDNIQIIIGPRKAGKSFLAIHQLTGENTFGYVSFENEQLVYIKNFDEILEAMLAVYPKAETIILDEVQYLTGWELIANRLQRKGYQIILTASKANLLTEKSSLQLSSRHLPIHLFTISFSEFLDLFDPVLTASEKMEKFYNYLRYGGYPEPLLQEINLKDYLQTLFDSIIYKDIVKKYKIRQASSLESLALWLISNITKEFSMNYLSRHLKISSVHTIIKYVNYLEETFMFFSLCRFSLKETDIQRSNKKIYCFDNGFYIAKSYQAYEDRGKLLENAVAAELYKRCRNDGLKLFYWKDRDNEAVNFVIQDGNEIKEMIQVCQDIKNTKVLNRDIRSLLKASRKLACTNLLIITSEEEFNEEYSWFGIKEEVQFVPAWKWMQNGY